MAIEASYLNVLKQVIDLIRRHKVDNIRALCLAYPDLLVTKSYLNELLGQHIVGRLDSRDDAQDIWAWHGLTGCLEPLYDTNSLFSELGISADIIDFVAARGDERIVDLNNPLPDDLKDCYDLVIDTGTCEHCFNVGQAFLNSCQAVALNGFLVHAAPISKCNHGFWNFCPTVYPDFLLDNGFSIELMTGVTGNLRDGLKTFDIDPFKRVNLPAEAAIYVVAKRNELKELIWPVQRKYRNA